jgi:hypothetical protein
MACQPCRVIVQLMVGHLALSQADSWRIGLRAGLLGKQLVNAAIHTRWHRTVPRPQLTRLFGGQIYIVHQRLGLCYDGGNSRSQGSRQPCRLLSIDASCTERQTDIHSGIAVAVTNANIILRHSYQRYYSASTQCILDLPLLGPGCPGWGMKSRG